MPLNENLFKVRWFLPMSVICIDYEFEIVLIFVIYEQDLL